MPQFYTSSQAGRGVQLRFTVSRGCSLKGSQARTSGELNRSVSFQIPLFPVTL